MIIYLNVDGRRKALTYRSVTDARVAYNLFKSTPGYDVTINSELEAVIINENRRAKVKRISELKEDIRPTVHKPRVLYSKTTLKKKL